MGSNPSEAEAALRLVRRTSLLESLHPPPWSQALQVGVSLHHWAPCHPMGLLKAIPTCPASPGRAFSCLLLGRFGRVKPSFSPEKFPQLDGESQYKSKQQAALLSGEPGLDSHSGGEGRALEVAKGEMRELAQALPRSCSQTGLGGHPRADSVYYEFGSHGDLSPAWWRPGRALYL